MVSCHIVLVQGRVFQRFVRPSFIACIPAVRKGCDQGNKHIPEYNTSTLAWHVASCLGWKEVGSAGNKTGKLILIAFTNFLLFLLFTFLQIFCSPCWLSGVLGLLPALSA